VIIALLVYFLVFVPKRAKRKDGRFFLLINTQIIIIMINQTIFVDPEEADSAPKKGKKKSTKSSGSDDGKEDKKEKRKKAKKKKKAASKSEKDSDSDSASEVQKPKGSERDPSTKTPSSGSSESTSSDKK